MLLQRRDVAGHLGGGLEDDLFFRVGIGALEALAPRRAVWGQGDPLMLRLSHTAVGDQVAGIELDLHFVFGFAHLHATPNPGDRDGVTVGGERHVSFHVHHARLRSELTASGYWEKCWNGDDAIRREGIVFSKARTRLPPAYFKE